MDFSSNLVKQVWYYFTDEDTRTVYVEIKSLVEGHTTATGRSAVKTQFC